MENSCTSGLNVFLYSCSGAANMGYLAAHIGRKLFADGAGKMACLAAVEASNSRFVESVRTADLVVVKRARQPSRSTSSTTSLSKSEHSSVRS